MREFFSRLSASFSSFMRGRYGFDELGRFLNFGACFFFILFWICKISLFYYIGFAMLIYTWFRALSRNFSKRNLENRRYLAATANIRKKAASYKRMWNERKDHAFYRCPDCKATVRINKPPRGKKIIVRCPRCGSSFQKTT